jgi:hypothetical protein
MKIHKGLTTNLCPQPARPLTAVGRLRDAGWPLALLMDPDSLN